MINHEQKRRDAVTLTLTVALLSNPSFQANLETDASCMLAAEKIASFCRQLAFKLQEEI